MDTQTRVAIEAIGAEHVIQGCSASVDRTHCHCTLRILSLNDDRPVECGVCSEIIEETRPIDYTAPRYVVIRHTQKKGTFWVYDERAKVRVGDCVDFNQASDWVGILNQYSTEKREELYATYLHTLKSHLSAYKARESLTLLGGWPEIVVLATEVEDSYRRFA